jgi:hypothetical protein
MILNTSFLHFFKNLIITDKKINKFYNKTHSNTKYNLDDIINDIFHILKTGMRRDKSSHSDDNINWRDSLYFINYNTLFYQ